jgi:hypothetical protein
LKTRVAVALLAGLALAACTQSVGGMGGAGAAAPAAGEPGAELPVIASRYAVADVDGQPVSVRVDLNEVRVVEQVLQVTFTARNTSAPPAAGAEPTRWQVADFFGDGTATGDPDSVDGVYVVDPVHTLRHLPGRNPDGQCLCSGGLGAVGVLPGDGAVLTATFAAPAQDVQVVNVHVPRVGVFTGVGVQR